MLIENTPPVIDGCRYLISKISPEAQKCNYDRMGDQCAEYYLEIEEDISFPVKVFVHGDENHSFTARYYARYSNGKRESQKWMEDIYFHDIYEDDVWMYIENN